jgi:hypothetical protein
MTVQSTCHESGWVGDSKDINIDTRWRWMASFTLRPLYRLGWTSLSVNHWIRGWVARTNGLYPAEKIKSLPRVLNSGCPPAASHQIASLGIESWLSTLKLVIILIQLWRFWIDINSARNPLRCWALSAYFLCDCPCASPAAVYEIFRVAWIRHLRIPELLVFFSKFECQPAAERTKVGFVTICTSGRRPAILRFFRCFLLSLQINSGISLQIMPQPLLSTCFQNYSTFYSLSYWQGRYIYYKIGRAHVW